MPNSNKDLWFDWDYHGSDFKYNKPYFGIYISLMVLFLSSAHLQISSLTCHGWTSQNLSVWLLLLWVIIYLFKVLSSHPFSPFLCRYPTPIFLDIGSFFQINSLVCSLIAHGLLFFPRGGGEARNGRKPDVPNPLKPMFNSVILQEPSTSILLNSGLWLLHRVRALSSR